MQIFINSALVWSLYDYPFCSMLIGLSVVLKLFPKFNLKKFSGSHGLFETGTTGDGLICKRHTENACRGSDVHTCKDEFTHSYRCLFPPDIYNGSVTNTQIGCSMEKPFNK